MLKKIIKSYIVDAHKAHENAKADLLKSMNNNSLTGTFGQSYIDCAMRAESLVNQLPITLEHLNSEVFEAVTEEDFRTWMSDICRHMKSREGQMQEKGLDLRRMWEMSGISQFRVFLESKLAERN